ncbi:tripartite tricarboxylate transporter substrate binding protein [Pasteurellaceae bacterium USgator11]|nr:tripartite tricarboxylate transporter substrate binding protein [Pasteurellaceae bacterium USgator41]TNG94187.1 tripartite tricarboxylate transporter substrate binding protein [Pasteurellaceae bacterium UScroc12]TNG95299.1 tripartite tricarboxylate transporter substrate binding protein [Pasteurellaceae bacterium UScroc31]TNH02014.1 tripartite tricarboxylate transporter substrate binding protein [Pasteurellaceae bacterium USgator11]
MKTLVLGTLLASSVALAAYPEKPLTIIVPWGAGGNTDTIARLVAKGLQDELGTNVNVVNRTGGSGVVGHNSIKTAKPDGYTLGVATAEIALMRHQKMADLSYQDYTPIVRLAVVNGGVQVAKDSPFTNINELLQNAKENPGKLKASGSGLNSIWHLNLLGILKSAGLPENSIKFIPSQGATAALQELVSGGVDLVTSSPGEAKSMTDAGMVKHLAITSEAQDPLYPDVPVYQQATGNHWTLFGWNVLVGPKDLPADVQEKLVKAMEKVYAKGELQEFSHKQGFGVGELYGQQLEQFMATEDKKFGELLSAQ